MSENKKFRLTDNTKIIHGITLYQIMAISSFANVEKGDLGGWIEKENNLSVGRRPGDGYAHRVYDLPTVVLVS